MCSLAVAEDLHPQSHQPLTLGRETSSEQPSGHRGCCKMCQGIPELYLGEETEKSRWTPGPRAGAILLGKMAHWSLLLRQPETSRSG